MTGDESPGLGVTGGRAPKGDIDDFFANDGELTAGFDGRAVIYGFGETEYPGAAYAATIHKSQGPPNTPPSSSRS
jgi:hypothetical protein